MKRSGVAKFPPSEQLFKFCQKILADKLGGAKKVKDQDIGELLDFNPSDCSHWKRGEKNIKSVFALAAIAEKLSVDRGLVSDVATGLIDANEAYFEHADKQNLTQFHARVSGMDQGRFLEIEKRMLSFVGKIHETSRFETPPLYLPEVFRNFSFISTQPVEMLDKLSRVLRVKDGEFSIQYKKGTLRSQTRHSIAKDLARILLHAERARFPELPKVTDEEMGVEAVLFVASLLAPLALVKAEISKLDIRKNMISELSNTFWAPKLLMSFQVARLAALGLGGTAQVTTKTQKTAELSAQSDRLKTN